MDDVQGIPGTGYNDISQVTNTRPGQITHLLLPFLQVEKHEVVVRKPALSQSKTDTVGAGRTASAVQSKRWHCRGT